MTNIDIVVEPVVAVKSVITQFDSWHPIVSRAKCN